MQGFMHFYCEKLFVARNRDPLGAEDVKRTEGWKFGRGLNSPTPVNSHPGSSW